MAFNVFGIKIEITFLFVAFIAFILSLKVPSNVLITVLSSLIHECGHLIMMIISDNKPKNVRFELTGINIIRNQDIRVSNKNEILISLGGPLMNLIIVISCCIYLCFYNNNLIMTFACINLILMVFNLLPIKQLDGGNILFYSMMQNFDICFSSKVMKITSVIFIMIIFIWGIYVLISSRYNISIIIIAIFLTLSLFSDNEC
jgi:stage IV sporulation protein FB